MRSVFMLIIFALLTTGCVHGPTPYEKSYKDGYIKGNIYYVEVRTNASTSQVTAAQYFHRRAREICSENGYQDYRVKDERDTSTSGVFVSHGDYASTGGTMNRPGFAGYVECIRTHTK